MAKSILFIYTNFSTFVKTDFEILSEEHSVKRYQFKPAKGLLKTAWQMFRQLLFLLLNIWRFDAIFIWFADYHSFLPVLFAKLIGKKSFVVIGGYDICRIPSLKYGVFVSKFRGFFALNSMKYSTSNLTVSNYVDRRLRWILPESNHKMIYNCVNLANDKPITQKRNLVLTVGQINNEQTFFRKGIDTFIEVAKRAPEIEFMIIGFYKEELMHLIPDMPTNLTLLKKVNQHELIKYYSEAKIYAQFSRMDTFCLTLAEAMLFGCYPIITNEGGMPEVIGRFGEITARNADHISERIKTQIGLKDVHQDFTNHIKTKFSPETRKSLILNHISVFFNTKTSI